jgi:signal transduction histidine kinase/CheY-like chemotaxis protein
MIVSSSDLLLTVVNDVLDYSKLESGNVEIEVRRSSLQETLDATVHALEIKGQSKNLIIKTFYDTMIPEYIHMDSRRLRQILYNLLGNAIKFSKDGGTVQLEVSVCSEQIPTLAEEAKVEEAGYLETVTIHEAPKMVPNPHTGELVDASEISSRCPFSKSSARPMPTPSPRPCPALTDDEEKDDPQSSSHGVTKSGGSSKCPCRQSSVGTAVVAESRPKVLRFQVKDYGPGIKEEDLERIFRPFHQASASTERIYGGTGLGLAITSKLVSGLGGSISVDSEEGKWAKFTVEFPLVDACADAHHISKKLKNATICLVGSVEPRVDDQFDLVCRRYEVDTLKFQTMCEMDSHGKFGNGRHYICLVHEDEFQSESYEHLATKAKSVLLTFGPKFSVKEAKGHYRSLLQVIPSVWMQSMICHLESSMKTSQMAASDVPSPVAPKSYTDVKVLIAEDNLINQKVLVRMLTKLGVTKVDVVDNGQKAVDQEASEEYDIVLMDMQMPVMDGIDACRLIVKRRGALSVPKVVFVTAHVEDSFKLDAARAGGSGFLSKPFNIKGVEKVIQNI